MAAANDGRMFDTPCNVVAGFRSRQQAETAARRLASAGLPTGRGGVAPRTDADPASGEFDDLRPLAERDVLLAVHVAEAETAERAARMLRDDLHADRVDLVDAAGTPLPSQHRSPRPADPEGYWWK